MNTTTRGNNLWQSIGTTVLLIVLGLAGLCAGPKSLILLIPVALLVWFSAWLPLRSGRN